MKFSPLPTSSLLNLLIYGRFGQLLINCKKIFEINMNTVAIKRKSCINYEDELVSAHV